MQTIRHPAEMYEAPASSVVAIGNFDGVHLGHRALLNRVVGRARAAGVAAAVLTFDPHPTQVLAPERAPKALTTLPEKLRLIEAAGIELVWVRPFTLELAAMSPAAFFEDALVRGLPASAVIVGPNFRFGHRQAGDVHTLEELGRATGCAVEIVEALRLRGQMVSSTRIRELAELGRVHQAGRLLGRPFSVSGAIVAGLGIGRAQTVPTLNLAPPDPRFPRQLPKPGVYVTHTRLAGATHVSVSNVGRKPTFGEHELTVESFLLDYRGGPIEAVEMEIEFLHRLRDERKFPDAATLKAQIIRDAQRSLDFFRRLRALGRSTSAGVEKP
ncbi:MAG TPA: bifunctional riboflavin kinase/FAD synthetase [Terriglobia bacterium]|jgi:riboflavin kinase/FMN adenylyltransferase|nr:bifunctional riboflavin kinase/FAD synthetase [Terriglobia bacterium]